MGTNIYKFSTIQIRKQVHILIYLLAFKGILKYTFKQGIANLLI